MNSKLIRNKYLCCRYFSISQRYECCAKLGEKELPHVKGLPFIGSALSIMASGSGPKFHHFVNSKHNELGPVYKMNIGQINAIFVADPSLMRKAFALEGKYPLHLLPDPWVHYNQLYNRKRGLFFMDGEEWHFYRRIMNKLLLKNDISAELTDVYNLVVDNLLQRWKLNTGNYIEDLELELYRNSISFVFATLMGSSYIKEHQQFEHDTSELALSFRSIFDTTAKLMNIPFIKLAAFLQLPIWKQFASSVNSSISGSEKVVKRMLNISSQDGLLMKLINEGIPLDIVEPIIIDLMLAAGDTTAYTTMWALYLLSKDADVQERLCQSKDPALVRRVVRETLRLYPPAIFITRTLSQPFNYSGYCIPAGVWLLMSMYTMGHSEKFYPEAERFWPERWERTGMHTRRGVADMNAYTPFALGARACVGRNIANAQMNMTINKIISKFRLDLEKEVEMVLRLIPVPAEPIRIKVSPR